MLLFKILWGVDAIASMVILYFFVAGLADGTVSSFNMGLWLLILLVLGTVMLGSIWLRTHQQQGFAIALLSALAIPAFLSMVFVLVMIFAEVKWQ